MQLDDTRQSKGFGAICGAIASKKEPRLCVSICARPYNSVNSATFSSDYGIVLRNYSLPQITVHLIARL